ncbi:hypothetical protein LSH36_166g05080 [Paralvinella palmiformis]|uniref:SOCS box domain-containing protein n=1 Tax=Paralvinella palmiformis TaxID=53620 RepID=A0AAD9JTE4_9ANNE|nr:hypothetical protein LSH36_166g05080 [Paralvinella palmiformis]
MENIGVKTSHQPSTFGCYLSVVQQTASDVNRPRPFGQSALHMASKEGMANCVCTQLRRGAKIDVLDWRDMTALMYASQYGHDAVVRCLVKNGAAVNLTNSKGKLALHYSCLGGHNHCTAILLENGAKPNYPDDQGNTPLILACKSNNVQVVQAVLDAGAKPDKVDGMKRSALHWAALSGNREIVDALISAGASLDLMDVYYATAFMYAIFSDNACTLKSLVASGCDNTAIDGMSGTALTLASLKGHDSCVSVLLAAGDDPDEFSYFGMTALMASVYESHLEVTQTILRYKPNINAVSRLGFTALFAALFNIVDSNAETRHKLLVLLIQNGADVNQPFGRTTAFSKVMNGKNSPLLFAITTGYMSLVKILMYAGSEVRPDETEYLKGTDTNIIYELSSVLKPITDYRSLPLPLQHICRIVIRKKLGSNICEKMEELPIPNRLKMYLNFSDLSDIAVQRCQVSRSFNDLALTMLDIKACGLQAIEGSFLFEQVKESVLEAQQPGLCHCVICLRIRKLKHILQ